MVEHVLCKHEVTGSNPVASTTCACGAVVLPEPMAKADTEAVPGDGTVSGV